nr:semaphorin-7A-like [Labrus bergylta]
MSPPSLFVFLLISRLLGFNEAMSAHAPRMRFSNTDPSMKRTLLPGDQTSVQILPGGEPDTVTAVGPKHLISLNFKNPLQAPVQRTLLWKDCIISKTSTTDCDFNITAVQKREEGDQAYVCGTNGRETLCCDVILSAPSPECRTSEKMRSIQGSIRKFIMKEGEPSVFVESETNADLYTTYSGSQENVGVHKFGTNRVGPANHNKEQHYVGLVISRQAEDPSQDKVFAFYKEKNRDSDLYSGMWLPFVSQVCMSDRGGPKKHMQYIWTSQMNARLYCGDPDSKQHFSELVHVAAVHAEHWQDSRVYALFQNEWGMSAVCVYRVKDFHNIFTNSPFKGGSAGSQVDRRRACVPDSTAISLDVLKSIEENSEMEEWVKPADSSRPLVFDRHRYTHISVDKRNQRHPVLFLSLHNGAIHKVTQSQNQTFVIAEYETFKHNTSILNMILNQNSMKLYAASRSELVQVDVTNCAQYGDRCEDCVLARDPNCGWALNRCVPVTLDSLQDVAQGKHDICPTFSKLQDPGLGESDAVQDVPYKSKYFLQCPVSSLHAEYTWLHPKGSKSCSLKEQECLLLIHSMSPEQDGTYTCESEEKGYKKVVVKYQLKLQNGAAGHSPRLLLCVCLMAVLLVLNK